MLDGLLLTTGSVQDISMRRRDLQRPYISKAYRILASPAVPITTSHHEDNISKTISSITESNKLVQRISFPLAFDNRPQQYFHNRSQPFLGNCRGRASQPPGPRFRHCTHPQFRQSYQCNQGYLPGISNETATIVRPAPPRK